MTRKVFNYSGGLHSQAALTAFLTDALAGDIADGMKVVPNSGMRVVVQAGTGRIDTGQQFSHDIQVSGIELVDCGPANPSNPVNTLIVAYIDKSVRGDSSVTDNTNDVFKLKAVDGVASVEPVDPTTSVIQQSIGASNPYIILARVQKRTGSSNILESDITDLRKMVTLKSGRLNSEVIGRGSVSAENVDWTTQYVFEDNSNAANSLTYKTITIPNLVIGGRYMVIHTSATAGNNGGVGTISAKMTVNDIEIASASSVVTQSGYQNPRFNLTGVFTASGTTAQFKASFAANGVGANVSGHGQRTAVIRVG